ncbi:MAG TPA: mechanosensitive ion channel domain-containing protein [Verrucomicrobiae bacterium]|nr:mechanosensitive ion channel domain-containing protein [Verrucomicrobiae bacterium]
MILLAVVLAASTATAVPVEPPPEAVLRLGNREILVLRTSIGASTPGERAAAAERRFDAAMDAGNDVVVTRRQPDGFVMLLGDRPIFMITPDDAGGEEGDEIAATAAGAAARMTLALGERREARDLKAFSIALGWTLLGTAVMSGALLLLAGSRRRLLGRIESGGLRFLRYAHLRRAARLVVTGGLGVGASVAAYIYITFVLTRFAWTRPWGEALGSYLWSTLAGLTMGAIRSLPTLFVVVIILVAARLINRMIGMIFDAAAQGTMTVPGIHPETARPTKRIISALVWLFAVVVAYPHVPGSDSSAFAGVSVFGGLLLTFGTAGIVGQAMSGLVLMYSRGVKIGDYVKVGEITGVVVELGTLSARLRTYKNEYVTLPNNLILGHTLTNYSFAAREGRALILHASVTIGYDVPWSQVHGLLIAAAKRVEGTLGDPAPYVLQRGLDDWYAEYEINVAVDPGRADQMPALYSRLYQCIQDSFGEAGVELMSPSQFSVRDGNTVAIPEPQRSRGRTPAFRVDVNPG